MNESSTVMDPFVLSLSLITNAPPTRYRLKMGLREHSRSKYGSTSKVLFQQSGADMRNIGLDRRHN